MACPEGHYCPAGVTVPDDCPLGTWSASTGLTLASECQDCSGGHYCNGTGLTTPSGPCDAGYYCTAAAVTPTPTDGSTGDVCTIGHHCPEGTTSPIPCADGTYMSQTQATSCLPCTPGYYCVSGSAPALCPPGFYCPQSTGPVWQSCPPGTYSISNGLSNETQCTQCDGGKALIPWPVLAFYFQISIVVLLKQ